MLLLSETETPDISRFKTSSKTVQNCDFIVSTAVDFFVLSKGLNVTPDVLYLTSSKTNNEYKIVIQDLYLTLVKFFQVEGLFITISLMAPVEGSVDLPSNINSLINSCVNSN